jgi:hypothetical protein
MQDLRPKIPDNQSHGSALPEKASWKHGLTQKTAPDNQRNGQGKNCMPVLRKTILNLAWRDVEWCGRTAAKLASDSFFDWKIFYKELKAIWFVVRFMVHSNGR